MRRAVEIACRYYFPPRAVTPNSEWSWQRHRETVAVLIPDKVGDRAVTALPPPFFGYNASHMWDLELRRTADGVQMALRTADGWLYGPYEWPVTALWTQVRFDPYDPAPGEVRWQGDRPHRARGGWWLRWRTPDANDTWARVFDGLGEISGVCEDPFMVQQLVTQLRREITMHRLGG